MKRVTRQRVSSNKRKTHQKSAMRGGDCVPNLRRINHASQTKRTHRKDSGARRPAMREEL